MEGYSSDQLWWKTVVHSVVSNSLQPHGLQHARLSYPSPSPRACPNSCPSSQWCHPTVSSSVVPFSSCLRSFAASRSFLMSWLFTSGGQRIGASVSASVLLLMEGNDNPLWYSYLGNPMERKAWWATVHVVAKSQTRLSDWACVHIIYIHTHIYVWMYIYVYIFSSLEGKLWQT